PGPEPVPPGRDKLLVGAGHPDFERIVPLGLEDRVRKAKTGGGLPELLGRLEEVGAVLGPQVGDGLAAQPGVWLLPDRRVAAARRSGASLGQAVSLGRGAAVSPSDRAARAASRQFPGGNGRPAAGEVDTAV